VVIEAIPHACCKINNNLLSSMVIVKKCCDANFVESGDKSNGVISIMFFNTHIFIQVTTLSGIFNTAKIK